MSALLRASLAVSALAACLAPGLASAQPQVPAGYQVQEIATGLQFAVGFDFLPDGRFIVIEQKQPAPNPDEGRVYLVVNGNVHGPILSITDINATGLERGLLGVTVDPAWPARPYIYMMLSHTSGKNVVRMYTATGDLTDPDSGNITLGSPYDLITDLPDALEWHNGGTLRFGPDGMLYVSHGDDATDSCARFQDPEQWHGVLLRLDVSSMPGAGSGPPSKTQLRPVDNPFVGGDNASLTYCIGLRNPFRFTIDSVSGRAYVGDVGELGYEELNEVTGGDNFGWPTREGAHDYPPGAMCGTAPGTDPIYEYAHEGGSGHSIIAGPRYRPTGGTFDFPGNYDGNVFALDFYAGWMRRFVYVPSEDRWALGTVVAGQPNSTDWAINLTSVSDMQMGPDGAIYMTRIFTQPFLSRIVRTPTVGVADAETASALRLVVAENPMRAGRAASFEFALETEQKVVARVFDVSGQLVAEIANDVYSTGNHTIEWSTNALAPGTYFVRLNALDRSATKKITITR